jgi:hypothetical protein
MLREHWAHPLSFTAPPTSAHAAPAMPFEHADPSCWSKPSVVLEYTSGCQVSPTASATVASCSTPQQSAARCGALAIGPATRATTTGHDGRGTQVVTASAKSTQAVPPRTNCTVVLGLGACQLPKRARGGTREPIASRARGRGSRAPAAPGLMT